MRWAAVEAVSGAVRDTQIASVKAHVGARRGRNIGRVAAARQLLTLVYYGLHDGEIRCLTAAAWDRATANGQLDIRHDPPTRCGRADLSELPLVVTARLHVTRHDGVTKVCPAPEHGLPPPRTDTRTEARFTVTPHPVDAPRAGLDQPGSRQPRQRTRRRPASTRPQLRAWRPGPTSIEHTTTLDGSPHHRYA